MDEDEFNSDKEKLKRAKLCFPHGIDEKVYDVFKDFGTFESERNAKRRRQ